MPGLASPLKHLERRWVLIALPLVSVLLAGPALWTGWHSDDLAHRLVLTGRDCFPAQSASPMRLFSFVDGDAARTRAAIESGLLPWWARQDVRIAFWRPLSALTHMLDYRLWPNSAALMHLHSLLWFAALVAAAAGLYRRMIQPAWVAALAGLLFALDDAHANAAGWLASRNLLVAGVFGIAALIAHDRWRRDRWRPGVVVAPLLLLLALLCGEAAVGVVGFLVAHAVFLDPGRRRARLAALVPSGVVVALWHLAYQRLGYGTFGSGIYIDPASEPWRFLTGVMERAPLQLLAQWAFPPSDLYASMSPFAAAAVLSTAVAVVLLLVYVSGPLLARDPVARFWALGMTLALVPNCATVPADRVLLFVGLGAFGLMSRLMAACRESTQTNVSPRSFGKLRGITCGALVLIHLVAAPILLPVRARMLGNFTEMADRFAESLPPDPLPAGQRLIMCNAPGGLWGGFIRIIRASRGLPVPAQVLALASGGEPVEIERVDAATLAVRPVGGYLAPPSDPLHTPADRKRWVHPAYVVRRANQVYRNLTELPALGWQRTLGRISVRITKLTRDGRPAEATFQFDVALEDKSLRWMQWQRGKYVPFTPPAVGERVVLPAGF